VRLKGAVVVITGASSGIGEAAALAFARKRASLVRGARRMDQLNTVAQVPRRGAPVTVRRLDVGQRRGARLRGLGATRPRTDHDAQQRRRGLMGRLHEMGDDKVDELMATNLGAPIRRPGGLPSSWPDAGVIIRFLGRRLGPRRTGGIATKHGRPVSHMLCAELSGAVRLRVPASTGTGFFANADRADRSSVPVLGWRTPSNAPAVYAT
jgi:NAD(P)-dependent dehydrogenase (short-subunit alcohol dehydrogenase family)